jgi:hypothetical protein
MFFVPALVDSPAIAGTWEQVRRMRDDDAPSILSPMTQAGYASVVQGMATAARTGQPTQSLQAAAAALGFELVDANGRLELWPVSPQVGAAGVLVLRRGMLPAELIVAAPHPFHDVGTGQIAARIFDEAPVRGLYLATQDRYAGASADPAHSTEHALQAATATLADALPSAWFVQLHGFGPTTSLAAAVVSDGAAALSGATLAGAVQAVSKALGVDDVRTGREVPALAGRTNVQGAMLRNRARFLHVELGLQIREQLQRRPAQCLQLALALVLVASTDGLGVLTGA